MQDIKYGRGDINMRGRVFYYLPHLLSGQMDKQRNTREEARALAEEGLPVYDFTCLFKDHSEEIFEDVIHVLDNGNEIIAQKILEIIKKDWQLQ
jgi:hypothetical protein